MSYQNLEEMTKKKDLIRQAKDLGFYRGVKVEWWGMYANGYESGKSTIIDFCFDPHLMWLRAKIENGKQFAIVGANRPQMTILILPDFTE